MKINVRLATASTLALGFTVAALAADVPAPVVVDVWPAAAPGDTAPIDAEKVTKKKNSEAITSITNVSKPTMTVSRPSPEKKHRRGDPGLSRRRL